MKPKYIVGIVIVLVFIAFAAINLSKSLTPYVSLTEAKKMAIPIVAICDTNCDPRPIDYPIPANDDAIRTIKLICSKIADAVIEGKTGGAALVGANGEGVPQMTEPLIFTPDDAPAGAPDDEPKGEGA